MKLEMTCYGCLICQMEKLLNGMDLPRIRKTAILREIIACASSMDPELPPPNYGREIHTLLKKLINDSDPYAEQKKKSNDAALSLVPEIKNILAQSKDPLKTALQISISGNIIDYGAPGSSDRVDIKKSLLHALDTPLDEALYGAFKKELSHSRQILVVGDNAGEIVFDRFLIEQMREKSVTYAVRGLPIINDATREDARLAGIDTLARVIDTGDSTPGIVFSRSSDEFLHAFSGADLIILKGQGNFETLFGENLQYYTGKSTHLYFLFKVKCSPVSAMTTLSEGSIAFLRYPAD
jgi:hypothetical protein